MTTPPREPAAELAALLSEAAGRSHSHLGPDCDPVADHGKQAEALLRVFEAHGLALRADRRLVAPAALAEVEGWLAENYPDTDVLAMVRAALAAPGDEALDVERLARAMRDWEARRHPVPSPEDDQGPHNWDAWIAEARKLLTAALAPRDPA